MVRIVFKVCLSEGISCTHTQEKIYVPRGLLKMFLKHTHRRALHAGNFKVIWYTHLGKSCVMFH